MARTATTTSGSAADVECWCCGARGPDDGMIRLGNHPEVALCIRCSRSVFKSGKEIEDRDRRGPAVLLRDQLRSVRRTVIGHGWHNNPVIGRGLRWIGRFTP